jgi:hypothetical protein
VEIDATHDASGEESTLSGGNMSTVSRRGDVVLRTAGPWTATVHRLLDHLRTKGIDWLPRPLGMTDQGREMLTYLPGSVPNYPLPSWVWADAVLTDAGRRLAEVHRAGRDFDRRDAVWQIPPHEPVETICLNDVAPYNMVFDAEHRLTGMIDIDTASPGPRVWDLAYLAYRLVPLSVAEDTGIGALDMMTRRVRLQRLCNAYAAAGDRVHVSPRMVLPIAVHRLGDLADFTEQRVAAGAAELATHVAIYRVDARWIRANLSELDPGLARSPARPG